MEYHVNFTTKDYFMNFYYYPLTSKDFTFENIFSSESVSPPCVYQLRTFGTDFFNTIPKFHHLEAIILYTEPPKYDLPSGLGDYIKFILKIPENALDPNEIVFISEKMVGYQKTIYLNRTNFELLFFSQKEITICSLKSEATLSTKSYKKYSHNFKVIDEKECKPFDTRVLETLDLKNNWQVLLDFDKKFNFFKGFCYGLLCGFLRSHSKKETELKRSLQNITNSFAEFKNKTSNDPKKKYDRSSLIKGKSARETDTASKVLTAISDTEQLFKKNLPGPEFQTKDIESFLEQLLLNSGFKADHIKLFIEFKKMEDVILGSGNFAKFKSQYLKSDHKNPILYFEFLREQVQVFSAQLNSTSDWGKALRDKASDSFKKIMYDLSRVADSQAAKPRPQDSMALENIKYSIDTNEIRIQGPFGDTTSQAFEEYLSIVDIILKNVRLGKGDAPKEDILKLVDIVASRLNTYKPGKVSHLYQYMSGTLNEYDPSKVQSTAMRNFIAFIFNPDSIERMESYLTTKEIPENWMAYTFWSAFNGFANLSRIFVSPYFETNDTDITDPIDRYLSKFQKKGNFDETKVMEKLPAQQVENVDSSDEVRKAKIENFYQEYIDGKFKLSAAQFEQIITLDDTEKMIDELKSRYRIGKKEGLKLIERFKDLVKSPSLF